MDVGASTASDCDSHFKRSQSFSDFYQIDLFDLLRSKLQCLESNVSQPRPLPFCMLLRMIVEVLVALPAERFRVFRIEPDRMQTPAMEMGAFQP
jgi:hypothetical protein